MKKIKIYLFCKDKLIEWEIDESQNKTVDFLLDRFSTLFIKDYVISFEYEDGFYKLKSTHDLVFMYKNQNVKSKSILDGDILVCNFPYESSKVVLLIQFEDQFNSVFYKFNVKGIDQIKIGKSEDNDIIYKNSNVLDYHIVLKFKENRVVETVSDAVGCYINQVKFVKSELKFGDVIFLYGFKCVYLGDYIAVNNPNENVYSELPIVKENKINSSLPKKFINFKKSIVDRDKFYDDLDEDKSITINPPNIDFNFNSRFLYFGVIPLVTVTFVLIVLGLFFKNVGSMVYLIYAGVIGILFTLIFYMVGVTSNKSKINQKVKDYNSYLNNKFKKLTLIREERVRALYQRYPKVIDCYKRVINFDKKLWERNSDDKDFLNLTIGQGNLYFENLYIKSDVVSNLPEDHELYKNYLKITSNFKTIKKAPITIPLREINKIAIVGDMSRLYDVVKNFLVQLTSLHSYRDLKIGFLYSKQHESNMDYVKEIPHVYSEKKDFRYVASNNEELVDVIYDIKNIISEREAMLSEDENQEFRTGYVIFIFYDFSLVIDSFLKYIKKVSKKINVSFVLVTIDNKNVPSSFRYVLDIDEDSQTFYKIQDNGVKKLVIPHDYSDISNLIDMNKFVYSLSKIKMLDSSDDIKKFENKSIFDLYGISHIDDLNIREKWNKNKLSSMSDIPIAVKNNKEIFSINIHAKHNGPNGIILGESGMGKTEFIKSLILSYCINFHPNTLNFIILKSNHNLKLNPFINLPHVVDILDKESESEKNRLILLIKNEISKRQALFDSLKVNDINSYLNIYDNYSNTSIIPHLVIVIDDVSDLDIGFIKEFTDLYASMSVVGIHVILSTNKVDLFVEGNEIDLSKFNFKVCFRFSSIKDMYNILEDNSISNPKSSGLFNVKFSDSQIFKNVEVAFSNVEHDIENSDENLDVVNNCGLIVKKVSRIQYFEDSITQQISIIDKIINLSNEMDLNISIFNSSLRYLCLQDLVGYASNFNGFMWCDSRNKCSAIVGIIDDPKYQVQRFLEVDFKNLGNLFVYGAPGTGKSTLIKTLVYSLCCEYKPNYLNVYMVDVNTRNTDYFSYAPHVKDIAYSKDEVNGLFKKILDEFELRKKIFENLDISSVENYKVKTGEQLPYVVLVIDSIQDIVNNVWDYSNFIKMLARDGKSYGIFVCVVSCEYGEIEIKLSEYFDNKFVLRLNNEEIYRKILGEDCSINSKFKGRGLVRYSDGKGSRILEFQVAIPMNCENDVELNNKLKSLFIQMNDINNRIYDVSDIKEALDNETIKDFEINHDYEMIEEKSEKSFDDNRKNNLEETKELTLSEVINEFDVIPKTISIMHNGISNSKVVIDNIFNILSKSGVKCYFLDNSDNKIKEFNHSKFYWYASDKNKVREFLIWLQEVVKNRIDKQDFNLSSEEKLCVFIPEVDIFLKHLDDNMFGILNNILNVDKEIGIYFVTSLNKKSGIDKRFLKILNFLLKDGLTIVLNHEHDLNMGTFVVYKSEKISVTID